MRQVASTDGVDLAVHDLGGAGSAGTVLVAHATGFHAHCYAPMAADLVERFHVLALDFRGHGSSTVDPTWEVDWSRFGDDALAVARDVAPDGGLIGFGHSMGGAALLTAAHRAPGLFERLVLFEPISHEASTPTISAEQIRALPIVQGALRRRRSFPTIQSAVENYRTKPPLSVMTPEALEQYVAHGFRPSRDDRGEPQVELRCPPEIEAGIFVTGRDNGVWALLPEITTPCLVVGGHVEDGQPSAQTQSIANRLPAGEYLLLDHQTHLGPFSHPTEVAELITR